MKIINEAKVFDVEFWNDSADIFELISLKQEGLVGCTTNPGALWRAIAKHESFFRKLAQGHCLSNRVSEKVSPKRLAKSVLVSTGKKLSNELRNLHEESKGTLGYVALQVDPRNHSDKQLMVEEALELSRVGPNVAVKIPSTKEGIEAIEAVISQGVSIVATIGHTLSQVLRTAEAVERGLGNATEHGIDIGRIHTSIAILPGRIEDFMHQYVQDNQVEISSDLIGWVGISLFKKSWKLIRQNNYRAKLLMAAYRNEDQFKELIGPQIIQSMPKPWWEKVAQLDVTPSRSIENDISAGILEQLHEILPFFETIYNDGLPSEEFISFQPSAIGMQEFIHAQEKIENFCQNVIRESKLLAENPVSLGSK